ncbi:MAG: hypothetical protein QOD46_292 [Actinomycetota bacterium]|jgi:hypothetical protein|nr:hypothetical protein [Actinomycetota bacterium]
MILAIHQTPSLTQERYEAVVRALTNGKARLESPSDIPVDGLLVHAAAQTENGFVIFDVFDSQESFDRFVELASPLAREVGIEEPPKAYPAHTFIST